MIRATVQVRVFVCTQPADMRRSFDGLCGMTRELIAQDPLSGHLFLFRNRDRDRLKILYWDRDGLAIWYKRLEQGSWQCPTDVRPQGDALAAAGRNRPEIGRTTTAIFIAAKDRVMSIFLSESSEENCGF
jgi:hypothetical protein